MTILLLAGGMLIKITDAYAYGIPDYQINYGYNFNNNCLFTEARSKSDYSPVYIKCTSTSDVNHNPENYQYRVYVYGTNSEGILGTDCTEYQNIQYVLSQGEEAIIENTVVNHGYTRVSMRGCPWSSILYFNASGVWCPTTH